MPSPQVWVLVNPGAAHADSGSVREALVEALGKRDQRHEVFESPSGPDGKTQTDRAIRKALDAGCRRFVVAGGDGTVGLIAAVLTRARQRHPDTLLGIVPIGTANILARDLGLPLAIPEAIDLALDGDHALELDAIQAADRTIFTQIGVGLDAQMIRHTSRDAQIKHGRLAYVAALVRRALLHRPSRYEIEIDGHSHRFRAWQVIVANIGTLGTPPFTWGPGIDPSDGILDVCVYQSRTIRDYLALIPRLFLGRHRRDVRTLFFHARERVVIRSHGPLLVQGDGEILGRTPITLELLPHAVRICVPRPVPVPDPNRAAVPIPGSPLASPAPAQEAIVEDVETMVAQRSRTWVLQGWLRHPATFIAAWDAAVFLRINALPLGRIGDLVLLTLSRVMHYGEGWAIVAAMILMRDVASGLSAIGEALPVLWITMLIVNFPLKRIFRRKRPFRSYVRTRLVGPEPKDFSFPSGHTAAAFAGAFLFGSHVPGASPAFYLLAVVVGFSRVYLGAHYPLDVLFGAGVGTALAAVLTALLHGLRGLFA